MLRVISGVAKGRRLRSVPGDTTRPVMDRVKEALFNILGGEVVASRWWDLFGGTGAVGIEALSRGAALVRFTEISRPALEVLRSNVDQCGFAALCSVELADALEQLAQRPDQHFDFAYIAPPQYQGLWSEALRRLDQNPGWLRDGGRAIAQIDPAEYAPLPFRNLVETNARKYGKTQLVFYIKKS